LNPLSEYKHIFQTFTAELQSQKLKYINICCKLCVVIGNVCENVILYSADLWNIK
jgi:hypothetical protein